MMHTGGILKVDAEAFNRVVELLRAPPPPSPQLIAMMRHGREALNRINGVSA